MLGALICAGRDFEVKPKETVPKFESEADEARWWDDHRAMVEDNLLGSMAKGTAQRGTAKRLSRQGRPSKNITIRITLEDIDRARRLAGVKGVGYQTLMKMLLHEALGREEAAVARPLRGLR